MEIESGFAVLMPTQTLYEVDERAVNHDSGHDDRSIRDRY